VVDTKDIKLFETVAKEDVDDRSRKYKDFFIWRETNSPYYLLVRQMQELPAFDFRIVANQYFEQSKKDTLLLMVHKKEAVGKTQWEMYVARTSRPFVPNNASHLIFQQKDDEEINKSDKFKIETFFRLFLKENIDITLITNNYEETDRFFAERLNGQYKKFIEERHTVLSKKEAENLFMKTPVIETAKSKTNRKAVSLFIFVGAIVTYVLIHSLGIAQLEASMEQAFDNKRKELKQAELKERNSLNTLQVLKEKMNDKRGIYYDN